MRAAQPHAAPCPHNSARVLHCIALRTPRCSKASFNTLPWLSPETASETLILYALSTINLLAFLVLLMVLVRNLIKLRRERIEQRLGARFKTRIVLFFVALSLLPVIFLFFASYGLINRSVDKWFSLPASEMVKNAREIHTRLRGWRAGTIEALRFDNRSTSWKPGYR